MNKKEELLINAAIIIHEKGIQNFTMEALAEACSLTKGGVLYHFVSKSQLLVNMNEFVIEQFEASMETFVKTLQQPYQFTKAYGLATLDYIQKENNILLPAVFITSLEEPACKQLWNDTLRRWERNFQADKGDKDKLMKFRLLCDGLWFSITYDFNENNIQNLCTLLKKELEDL